jgi:hypothetical protein
VPQLPTQRRTYALIAAAILVVVVVVVVVALSGSKSPAPTTSTTGPTVINTAGDCQSSKVSFSSPGSPALTKYGTYVAITITNESGAACKFPLVKLPATKASGYGLIFAQGASHGSPVGPVSTLRGTVGSKEVTLPVGTPPSTPTAQFTFGLSTTKSVAGCLPKTVSSIAFSLDGVHWQTINFKNSPYFPQGVSVCTGPISNLNVSPVSLIPPNKKAPAHKK